MKTEIKDIRTFVFAFTIILSFVSFKFFISQKNNVYYVFLSFAIFLFIIALLKPLLLKPLYIFWMAIARLINTVIVSIILTVIFYLIITPIGLFLRLIGKDLLELKKNRADSYWKKKEQFLTRESYLKQF